MARGSSLVDYRAELRPQAELYGFNLADQIPPFPMPLKGTEQGPMVDLNELLQQVYDQGSFDLAIVYSHDPVPPLPTQDADWLRGILASMP